MWRLAFYPRPPHVMFAPRFSKADAPSLLTARNKRVYTNGEGLDPGLFDNTLSRRSPKNSSATTECWRCLSSELDHVARPDRSVGGSISLDSWMALCVLDSMIKLNVYILATEYVMRVYFLYSCIPICRYHSLFMKALVAHEHKCLPTVSNLVSLLFLPSPYLFF